jgi:IclR family transcriptional regulator, acetate operon repressor
MRDTPPAVLDSVDKALQLIELLRERGTVRVSEAADRLGVGRSTAHRLLATLVHRGFAEQGADRAYRPGPWFAQPPGAGGDPRKLRRLVFPAMESLCDRVDETVHLMVLAGTRVRFLATVESSRALRVGDRGTIVLPAAQSSGGKALLAELEAGELADLYGMSSPRPAMSGAQWTRLTDELRLIRRRGYALNIEATESGVCAIGMPLRDAAGEAVAALGVALPRVRYVEARTAALVGELRAAVAAAQVTLRRYPGPGPAVAS